MFHHPTARLTIGSLDKPKYADDVIAQYNPKDIDLAKQTNWQDPKAIKGRAPQRENDLIDLEYTGTAPRTMSLELFFDGYETGRSVEPMIDKLNALSSPRVEESTRDDLARPHVCIVAWGDRGIRPFTCVIESLAVKYTMFGADGTPLRATCQVKLKEVKLRSR